jgi:hypothetical protein
MPASRLVTNPPATISRPVATAVTIAMRCGQADPLGEGA